MGEIQDQLYMQVVAVVVLFALAKTDNQEHQVLVEQVILVVVM